MKTNFSNSTLPLVVGIGELLWDRLPQGKRAGGAPVNVVYHASQMGVQGVAISAVGKDALGDELLETMDRYSIPYIAPRVDYPTGVVEVELCKGSPSYHIVEDVAWDYLPLSIEAISAVEHADAIAYGTLAQRNKVSQATILKLLSLAPTSALKYYDVNLRQNYYSKETIDRLLKFSNVLKINDEELEVLVDLFGIELPENTLDQGACSSQNSGEKRKHMAYQSEVAHWFIRQYNLRYCILTAGADYSVVYTLEDFSMMLTPKVDVCDTVGAGDSFSGAFLASVLQGKTIREAHRKAVEVAAFVCSNAGAWPRYPKTNEA